MHCIALHHMPYFIFLKSLRSLEKFKKNPHIKIPPKSPFINFQSLDIFKNPIFILKRNSLQFWPNQPTGLFGLFGPRGQPPAFLPPPAELVSSPSRSHVATPPPPGPPWPPFLLMPVPHPPPPLLLGHFQFKNKSKKSIIPGILQRDSSVSLKSSRSPQSSMKTPSF
jgi:hypothetical protein